MKTSSRKNAPPAGWRYVLDAHHRIFASSLVALATFLALQGRIAFGNQLVLSWCAFTFTAVVLAWIVICTKDPYHVRRDARLQDSSATFLFVLVIFAAIASLFAVGYLLGTAKGLSSTALVTHIAFSVSAVVLSWTLVHTLFTLRYAHAYFFDAHKVERHEVAGGLLFPGKESPNYLDFAYFSFVIGMTCQVSDVQIASPRIRRLALVHGLISFLFNTAILAMFVNIIASLV